jgi:ferric-dicitrate binding protein FerR (iron transport regulator)
MSNGNDMGKDMRPDHGTPEEHREIAKVLAHASAPPAAAAAAARLMARIADEAQEQPTAKVPDFAPRPRPAARRVLRFAAALPLAASLALGVYLGAKGTLDFMLPAAITGGVAANEDLPDELGGVGEADAYAEESLS